MALEPGTRPGTEPGSRSGLRIFLFVAAGVGLGWFLGLVGASLLIVAFFENPDQTMLPVILTTPIGAVVGGMVGFGLSRLRLRRTR